VDEAGGGAVDGDGDGPGASNQIELTLNLCSQKANPKTDPQTFSGSVTLRKRVSKNVYDLEMVRFVPHPPLEIATAIEARHFVATYALFRVSRE
jgi:hypothetical protein